MSKENIDSIAYTLTNEQGTLCAKLGKVVYDALMAKGGIVDLADRLEAKKGQLADKLTALYAQAEMAGKTPKARVACFEALAQSFEAALQSLDAAANGGEKRKVGSIWGSWPVMKSEIKRALLASVPSVNPDDKPRSYSELKAERQKVDPTQSGAGTRPDKASKPVQVSGKLAAAMVALNQAIASDPAAHDLIAEAITDALAALAARKATKVERAVAA